MIFQDRRDAGRRLAAVLAAYRGADAVVYALPRGGVVLGAEVAQALGLPLDIIITRKVGHPLNPEYAICAVGESGTLVCNDRERARVDPQWLEQAVAREGAEAAARRTRYRGGRPSRSAEGKIAILVDDGIATGLTMRAAIREVQAQHPREVVAAVPVIPRDTARALEEEGARAVGVEITDAFLGAVGRYYRDFHQVSDEEVIALLSSDPPLFAGEEYAEIARRLCRLPHLRPGAWAARRFPNGELQIVLPAPPPAGPALVLATPAPPDARLLTMLLLCDTLRKEGAEAITLLAPYLPYMRQDHDEAAKSRAAAWLGALLGAVGVRQVIAVDLHSRAAAALLPMPVVSLSPAPLLASEIARLGWSDAVLVAPDAGAALRCADVRDELNHGARIVTLHKERTPAGVRSELREEAGPRAILIDDILDTGGTLVAACRALRAAGTREILVMVTHGLFTGDHWRALWDLGVSAIYCTDTLPRPDATRDGRIHILSILPLLEAHLIGWTEEAS